eukprot:scaffold119822_cov63-Phaeocystis_antarctica.AAC.3
MGFINCMRESTSLSPRLNFARVAGQAEASTANTDGQPDWQAASRNEGRRQQQARAACDARQLQPRACRARADDGKSARGARGARPAR